MNNILKDEIEAKLSKAMLIGPTFGESMLQVEAFNINKHGSQERQYRQLLLELDKWYTALKKAELATKKTNAEIELLKEKISKQSNPNKKIILECDLEDKHLDLKISEKRVLDAINLCNFLYAKFEQYPEFTRNDFEKSELAYWRDRFIKEAQLSLVSTGTVNEGLSQSLVSVGINPITMIAELKHLNHDIQVTHLVEKAKQEALQNKELNLKLVKE